MSVDDMNSGIKCAQVLRGVSASRRVQADKMDEHLREVLKSIPLSEVNPSIKDVNLDFEGLPTDRALGVVWD